MIHLPSVSRRLFVCASMAMRAVRVRRAPSSCRNGQRGIALATALILLVVVTLVGMAAVRGTILQQKMTANFYDREVAFQAAEAALRQGEAAVLDAAGPTAFRDCSATSAIKCVPDPFVDITVRPVSAPLNTGTAPVTASTPQFVVEYLGNFIVSQTGAHQVSNCSGYAPCGIASTSDFYRITARSGSPVDGRASVTLQTVYRR